MATGSHYFWPDVSLATVLFPATTRPVARQSACVYSDAGPRLRTDEPVSPRGMSGSAASVNNPTQARRPVRSKKANTLGDADYEAVEKREEAQDAKARWLIAMHSGKRCALNNDTLTLTLTMRLLDEGDRRTATLRTSKKHPFSRHQAALLPYEGMLRWTDEEHAVVAQAVRIEKFCGWCVTEPRSKLTYEGVQI